MADRKTCDYCKREIATEADWEANGNLPSGSAEDTEAERLGLNALCWEPFQDSCIARVIELGGPLDMQQAIRALRAAEQQRDELLAAIEDHRTQQNGATRGNVTAADRKLYRAAERVRKGQ